MNFPFLDGDVPRSTSDDVYISPLTRFARVSSHVDDFNTRNKNKSLRVPSRAVIIFRKRNMGHTSKQLTAKLLRQGYLS